MASEGYVVGVDGGGTKTVALLATADGHVVGRGVGGPANVQIVGAEAVRHALAAAIDAALAGATVAARRADVRAAVLGVAGVHTPLDVEAVTSGAALLPSSRVEVLNDGVTALRGATGGRPGIAVVAGTGSISYGLDDAGRLAQCGGWGPTIADEGSAYSIVRRALGAAARAHDGRGPATALLPALMDALGAATFEDLLRPVYGPPALTRDGLAALAVHVTRYAEGGDPVARGLLAEAGEELALMATVLAGRCNLGAAPFPVACIGGVWTAGELVAAPFRRRLHAEYPRAVVGPPALSPAAGAVLAAIELLQGGETAHPSVVETLRATQGL